MNRSALAITALAALNAALLGYVAFRPTASTSLPARPASTPSTSDSAGPTGDFAAVFTSGDHAALLALLQRSGFPKDVARDVVRDRIRQSYRDRIRAINPEPQSDARWWRYVHDQRQPGLTPAQLAAIDALERESDEMETRIVGSTWTPKPDPRLAFLPPDKLRQIERIKQDYDELEDSIERAALNFFTPADRARLELLRAERVKDILAVMTPGEREAYELRMSPVAERVRRELGWLDVSEAEYTHIYALHKRFDEKYRGLDPFAPVVIGDTTWSDRARDEKAIKEQIKALIGEERYRTALKEQDTDYRALTFATRRFDLPGDTPDRVYALRNDINAVVSALSANTSLPPSERQKALVQLAVRTREQVQLYLGAEAAEAYLAGNMSWLKTLDGGIGVLFSHIDTQWETHPMDDEFAMPIIRVE